MEKTFDLKSLKLDPWGGVECKYRISETDDNDVETKNDYHVKVARPIHGDLSALFEKDLTAIVAVIFDNTEWAAELELGIDGHIIPTGISFAGKNDNVGIAISGEIRTKFGRVSFKTPRIKYLTSQTTVAAKLTVFADKVVNEAHAYLFENKTAETGVFGE